MSNKKANVNVCYNGIIPADTSGTGCWRFLWQNTLIEGQNKFSVNNKEHVIFNTVLQKEILDEKWFENFRTFMIQRFINKEQREYYTKFIVPCSEKYQFWTIYNLDDAPHYLDIPKYNRGGWNYRKDEIADNIKAMMNSSDFVLVTTEYLKDNFIKRFGIDPSNFIIIPNLLPRFLFDDYYDIEKKTKQFSEKKKNKQKIRVGIISSLSHYNVDNIYENKETGEVIKLVDKKDGSGQKHWINPLGNPVEDISGYTKAEDDMSDILDLIVELKDSIQWVFLGTGESVLPEKLHPLIQSGEIECHPGVNIYNYPSTLNSLNLQAIVAPLLDNEFNRCKSNIKYLECAAMGIPLIAKNMLTYNKYMPAKQLYNTSQDLKIKLMQLTKMSNKDYSDMIEKQHEYINKPVFECGWQLKNWWLEDNMTPWVILWTLRKKSAKLSIKKFMEAKQIQLKPDKVLWSKDDLSVVA